MFLGPSARTAQAVEPKTGVRCQETHWSMSSALRTKTLLRSFITTEEVSRKLYSFIRDHVYELDQRPPP